MNRHTRDILIAQAEAYLAFYAILHPTPAFTYEPSQSGIMYGDALAMIRSDYLSKEESCLQ